MAYWCIFPSIAANSAGCLADLERQLMEDQELCFASVIGKEQNLCSYDLHMSLSYYLGKSPPKCSTEVFSNILGTTPFTFLKIIATPKSFCLYELNLLIFTISELKIEKINTVLIHPLKNTKHIIYQHK